MKTEEGTTTNKAEQAAKQHFDRHENIQDLAVILKEETGAWVSVHRRDEGQLMCVDFPITYENLEYAAQRLLRRFDVVRTEIVYA